MTSYKRLNKEALKALGEIPSDHEGMDALREKVWVEIKDFQWDQAEASAKGDSAAVKRIQREIYLRYTMSTILTRAIRKEKRNDPQRSVSTPESYSRG